jgi:hypothetical protein
MRRFASAAVALCLLAGCGGNDEKDVTATVNRLYAGFADRDAGKVCDQLTERLQRDLGRQQNGCRTVIGFALGFTGRDAEAARKAKVTKVAVHGSKARATVRFKGKLGVLGLTKEDGDWRVSDLDATRS